MAFDRRRALAAAALLLASCASVPPAPRGGAAFVPLPDVAFEIAGRLSARQGSEGVAANYRWRHARDGDELTFATPLGSALARLAGGGDGVRLELANGHRAQANDWETLTAQVVGAPLPVRGLAWWVRASPRPGSPFDAEADAAGRLAVLRQDGWEVVYGYRDADPRPTRVTLAYPEVEIRIVVDEWAVPP